MINIRYSILFKIERKRKYFSYKKKKVSIVKNINLSILKFFFQSSKISILIFNNSAFKMNLLSRQRKEKKHNQLLKI